MSRQWRASAHKLECSVFTCGDYQQSQKIFGEKQFISTASPLSFGIHCTAYKVLFHTCNSVAHAHMYSWAGQAIAVEWPARCRDIQIQKIIVRGVFFYCLVDQTGVWCIVLSFQFKGKNTLLSMSEPGSSVHEMEKGWRQCMPVTKIADCKMLLSSNCISENKMYVHTDTDIDTHRQTHTQLYKLTKW